MTQALFSSFSLLLPSEFSWPLTVIWTVISQRKQKDYQKRGGDVASAKMTPCITWIYVLCLDSEPYMKSRKWKLKSRVGGHNALALQPHISAKLFCSGRCACSPSNREISIRSHAYRPNPNRLSNMGWVQFNDGEASTVQICKDTCQTFCHSDSSKYRTVKQCTVLIWRCGHCIDFSLQKVSETYFSVRFSYDKSAPWLAAITDTHCTNHFGPSRFITCLRNQKPRL